MSTPTTEPAAADDDVESRVDVEATSAAIRDAIASAPPGATTVEVVPAAAPVVTADQAAVLAAHAHYVQGGFSTPEVERERLLADAARQDDPQAFIDATCAKFQAELSAAVKADVGVPASPAEAAAAVSLASKVRRYKELREAQTALDAEVDAIKAEADRLEVELVAAYAEDGVQNMNVDGKTVYLHRSTFAQRKPEATTDAIKDALRQEGFGDLVSETINAQTLSAFVRERLDADEPEPLPGALADLLELGERFAIRINAGGSRAKSKTKSK